MRSHSPVFGNMHLSFPAIVLALVTMAASMLPGSAAAQNGPQDVLCYLSPDNDGFNNSNDGISYVNQAFSETALGLTGTRNIEAITRVPSTGKLYAADADEFGEINLNTGAFSLIGSFGDGDGAQGNIDFDDVDGLAWDPFTQTMYASARRDGGDDDVLFILDITTGEVIEDSFGAGVDYVVVEKINGLDDVDDIAISTDNGMMYAIQNDNGDDSRLITINKATGATTDIGDLDVDNVEGLGFHPDGRLLGVNGDSFRSVMEISLNPFSSTTTPIANLGVNNWRDYEGIACLSEPDNTIQGSVFGDPQRIDLELDKTGQVTAGQASDQIEYTITLTNDNQNPVQGGNPVSGSALSGVTVRLYRDKGTIGVYDVADEFVAATQTAGDGSYEFVVSANGAFIVRVDLSTITDNAYDPTDNEEAVSFAGFGETSTGNDFNFYQFTDADNIIVTDVLPVGASYVSDTPSQGSYNSGNGQWDVGTIAPGASATLVINATTSVSGQLENCAEVTQAGEIDIDSLPGNGVKNGEDDQDCAPTNHVRPDVDLKLDKTADIQEVGLGETIVYTLTVTNEGGVDATGVVVTDDLPYGVSFVSSNPASVYDAGDHTVTWTVGDLDAGQSKQLEIEVVFDGFTGTMPSSAFLADGEYILRNHPDGNVAPPFYGMRLDELFGDFSTITFDFNHPQSDMRMTLSDNGATAVISGTTWGGADIGGSYDHEGVWNVYFIFNDVLSNYPGDDDLAALGGDAELSSGSITPLYNSAWFTSGQTYQLSDKEAGGYSFRLGDRSDDNGHRGHDGISGWGWLNHDGDGVLDHKNTSDFLFTAYWIPENVENCAEITSADQNDSDSTPDNAPPFGQEDDDACVTIPRVEDDPEVDIEVDKTASTLSPAPGQDFTYTITVSNNGPADATGLVITENLPAGLSYVSHVASAGAWNPGTGLWTLASLPAFASETLEITVTLNGASSGLGDGTYKLYNHPGNDMAPPGYGLRLDELFGGFKGITFDFNHPDSDVQMTIDGADVTIQGQVYGGVDAGGTYDPATEGLWDVFFEYDGVVSSVPGDDDLFVDDPDSEVSTGTISPQYNSAWFTNGDIFNLGDKSDGAYSFRLGDEDDDLGYEGYNGISGWGWLEHGTNGNLQHVPISDWVFTAVPFTGSIENCAELTSLTEDDSDSTPNDGFGDDYDCITVTPGDPKVDLDVEKTVDLSEAAVGQTLNYTITVSNAADADVTATNVVVQDVIPDGLLIIDTTPSANVNIDAGTNTVTWLVPSIAPGESFVLNIEVQIIEPGFFCNCAQVISADQEDRDDIYGDDTGEDYDCAVTTTDDPFVDVSIQKTAYPNKPSLGDIVDYTLTVRNDASATETAYAIQVVDNVPAGLSIQSTNPTTNVSVNNATNVVSWLIPALAPGEEVILHIYAQVNEPGKWKNCAEIMSHTGSDVDSTPGNGVPSEDDYNCATTRTPDPTIDLSLEKTVDDANPAVGQDITFTLSVTNDVAATEAATGVVVEDQLPGGVTIDPGFNHPDVSVSLTGLVTWNVGTVGIGDTESINIPVEVVSSTAMQNCAEITAADQDDVDSVPGNGTGNGEDDQDCVTVTPDLVPSGLMCYLVADNESHSSSADVLTYIKTNGQEFSIGITGTDNINAIEYVGATGKLYAANADHLGTLNPANGLFTPLLPFGSGSGSQGVKSFDDVKGLALHPYTGVMYGSVRSGGEDLLIQINLVTGKAVQDAFGPGQTYVVIPSVAGLNEVDDIAFSPANGKFYGVMNGTGNSRIIEIDPATGASSDKVLLDVDDVRGLAFRSNNQLLGSLGSTTNQVRRINLNNGSTTLTSNLGVDGNFDYEAITCNTNVPNMLTGTVFLDNNEDALLDAGDVGQEDVTVNLFRDQNNNGVLDGPDFQVGSTTTNVDGDYSFKVLYTGRYIVQTDLSSYPAGAVLTTDNIETAHFTGYGQSDEDNDFGFKLEAVVLGSIGDEVFSDDNANGIRDGGEAGITGILIRLYNGTCPPGGSPVATRVSNLTGGYDFTMLPAGTYCIDVDNATIPNGYVLTTGNDPMQISLGNGEDFDLADFGLYFDPDAVQADLELTKEVDTSSPALDGVVEFTITVTNHGPADATGLIVRDIIPVGLVFQDYDSSRGTYEANKLGYWTIGDLAVGQTETLRIRTKVVITNMIENIAQVSHVDQEDPDSTPGNGVPSEDDQDNALVESRGPGSVGDIVRVECADMGTVNALQYSTYDGQIYAGTEVGTVHISNDDGQNWPAFLNTDNDAPVRDIVLDSNGDIYVGTFGDGVYRSQNSGDSWTNFGPPLENVNDLDVDNNTNQVYAAADGRVIMFNGAIWSEVGAGTNPFAGEQVLAVVFNENNGDVLAASAGSGVWRFSGGSWSDANTGLPTGKVNVLVRGPNGEILAGHNNSGIYIFGGGGWFQFGMGLDNEPIESIGTGPNGELLAGSRETGAYFYNFITGDWTSIGNLPVFTVSAMTGGPLGEVYAGAPGEGIYAIYDSDFDGIPDIAHQVANFMTSAIIQDLVVAPNGDMWAATYGYGVLYSSDGGNCWTRMNRGLENLWTFAIERRTDGTLFIGIWADGLGGIWRSRDDGRNWEFLA